MSLGYDVLKPKSDQALPIPCNEWDSLKDNIRDATAEPWLFHTIGSVLLGAGIATAISVLTGADSSQSSPNAVTVAWAAFAVCVLTGVACLYFAHKERGVHRAKARNVLTQMELIESRFDRPEELTTDCSRAAGQAGLESNGSTPPPAES